MFKLLMNRLKPDGKERDAGGDENVGRGRAGFCAVRVELREARDISS